jgi:hypothetical protein
MFGLRPDGPAVAVGEPGAAFCACANASVAIVAATSAVPLRRMLRRLGFDWFFSLIVHSHF